MIQTFLDTLHKTLALSTAPVAVALASDEKSFSPDDFRLKGKRLAVCQQIAYARYYGWSTLCTAADSHCVLGASNTGLIDTPERVLSGSVNCGVYQKDIDAAAEMQAKMPRIPERKYAVATFPLNRMVAGITPDAVVIYMNTAQAMRMTQAFLYRKGGELTFSTSGDAGVCSRSVAEAIMKQKPVVEIPCLGDRRFAMAQNDELAVGFPFTMLEEVTEGLLATHKAGIRYPIPYELPEACHLPPTFVTVPEDIH